MSHSQTLSPRVVKTSRQLLRERRTERWHSTELSVNKIIDFLPPQPGRRLLVSAWNAIDWFSPTSTGNLWKQKWKIQKGEAPGYEAKFKILARTDLFRILDEFGFDFGWIWFTSLLVWIISLVVVSWGKNRSRGGATRDLKLPTLPGNNWALPTAMTSSLGEVEKNSLLNSASSRTSPKKTQTQKKNKKTHQLIACRYISPLGLPFKKIIHIFCSRIRLSLIPLIWQTNQTYLLMPNTCISKWKKFLEKNKPLLLWSTECKDEQIWLCLSLSHNKERNGKSNKEEGPSLIPVTVVQAWTKTKEIMVIDPASWGGKGSKKQCLGLVLRAELVKLAKEDLNSWQGAPLPFTER